MKRRMHIYDLPAVSIITNLLLIKHNLELKKCDQILVNQQGALA
jgi:hypothetical protein